jgi:serine/threonine protein kinase
MAPEIVIGTAKPSRNTDLYSLAVLLFYMFMLHHPLDGKLESDIKCMDIFAMTQLYGKKPVFIFDPDDENNRPVKGYHDNAIIYWEVYPQSLKNLFTMSFTVGLSQPNRRVTENQWLDALSNLMSQITTCPKCGAEAFIEAGKCWACGCALPVSALLTIEKRRVYLNEDSTIYSHHIKGDYNINTPVGRVVCNPNNPAILGIHNDTSSPWVYIKADRTELPITSGRSAAIADGTKINFGKAIGEISI